MSCLECNLPLDVVSIKYNWEYEKENALVLRALIFYRH
jgi:hypothetical protein